MTLRSILLSLSLVLSASFAAPHAFADGPGTAPSPAPAPTPPPKTPEQLKQEQKDKDFKKAKDALEAELTKKKQDPAPACALLQYLAYAPLNLEVKEANALTRKVLAKKIPIATDVMTALGERQQKATDAKTGKLDVKKMMTEFKKWMDAWKPPAPSPTPAPAGK